MGPPAAREDLTDTRSGYTYAARSRNESGVSGAEGRIAAKAAVKYVMEKGREQPQVSEDLEKLIYQPLENYRVGRNEIVAGTVSPSYLLPIQGLQRLEKLMDEYVGGISTNYIPLRPEHRQVGNGEGARPPHHRLRS